MHLRDLPSIFTGFLQKTVRMAARSLLSVLLLLSSSCTGWCATICNNRCCSFVEGFPARLKMLRENYSNIRDYYVSTHGNVGRTSAAASFGAAGHVPELSASRGCCRCFRLLTPRSLCRQPMMIWT